MKTKSKSKTKKSGQSKVMFMTRRGIKYRIERTADGTFSKWFKLGKATVKKKARSASA